MSQAVVPRLKIVARTLHVWGGACMRCVLSQAQVEQRDGGGEGWEEREEGKREGLRWRRETAQGEMTV